MNIQQAEEVINGIKAECEGGNLDWGFVHEGCYCRSK